MERAVNDKTIMGGEWGFYKERVIQWPQLKPAKCQDTENSKMLVEETHLPLPPKSGQKKESQIQYPVLDLLQKIQEMKKWANDSTGCPLIRSEGTPLYRKNGLVFPKLKDLNYERKLERSEL